MGFYPVIMCGGAGTRLWPASRPSRPKQFIALAGNRSLFQDTAERVAGLVENGGHLIVVAGIGHGDLITDQLASIGIEATVLLEPQPRDSAAAMAAAAAWVHAQDPEGMIAFVASDHFIPDAEAFRLAVREAASEARKGRIVTLGVQPTEPSPAYGYIAPAAPGLAEVTAFHEKPDSETAAAFIAAGYLWNSGNFITSAATMIEELRVHAPAVMAAAEAALQEAAGVGSVQSLNPAFLDAPRISIDYAVMEKTERASVLAVDFAWSDLGAWDSIAQSGAGSVGIQVLEDAQRILTRAPDGVVVAALGVSDLAIIVEADAVLVCSLDRAQSVKAVIERIRTISPQHLDFPAPPPEDFDTAALGFAEWMRLKALPVWSTLGLGSDGGFAESLTQTGRSTSAPRRARVQTRQIYVYAMAGLLGWEGNWRSIVAMALDRLRASYLRPDGACRSLLATDWSVLDDEPALYDQAFVLLALATARRAGVDDPLLEADGVRLRDLLLANALPNGAFRERGDHPFQANAHMHLLEACMAWAEISEDQAWSALVDQIADLAMTAFFDSEGGFLREFFNDAWGPADGEDGSLVEPGHQFEWAWLLIRYGRKTGSMRALDVAQRLYTSGRKGAMHRPPVCIDAMNTDGSVRSDRARLWPQTEWLKAALILAETCGESERPVFMSEAAAALGALRLYLTPEGLWRDKRLPDGSFIEEAAPATSLYHMMAALDQIGRTVAGPVLA